MDLLSFAYRLIYIYCAAELTFGLCFSIHTLFYKEVCFGVVWLSFLLDLLYILKLRLKLYDPTKETF